MRQGKGTDVLGANDPRSDAIGVIYVSPNDDRKSILAAILTQEKLGRKQVAVVLPPHQNKAFQRPDDFDDLKTMRRKLQTQVVFIAPSGPGPAEFARQRRFHVYSSLENFANALRDEVQVESASKKGWLFGSPRAKAENGGRGGTRIPTEPLTPSTQELDTPANEHSSHYDSDEDEQYGNGSGLPLVAGAALGGGAALAADSAFNARAQDDHFAVPARPSRTPQAFEDDADDLGPLPANSARQPAPEDLYGSTQAIPPAHDAEEDGGSIIELRPRRSKGKATLPLTPRDPAPVPVVPVVPVVAPEPESTTQLPRPRRNSGKMAAAVGAVAGVAASEVAATPARSAAPIGRASAAATGPGTVAPRPGGPGGIPPRGTPPGGGGGRNNRRGPRSTAGWIIFGAVVLLISLLVCGGVMAYAQPNSLPGHVARGLFSQQQSPATITITPGSQTVQDTYTLVGANTTNPTSRQVADRIITGAAQSPSTAVKTTGHAQHAASEASGHVTFFNSLAYSRQINAGQTLNVGGGVQVVTSQTAFIPAAAPPLEGSIIVAARSTPAGRGGNIGAYTFGAATCCATGITVTNTAAFTGGQDAVNYAFLQHSDVNSAISQSVMDTTKQKALNDLNRQLRPGEQFTGSTHCRTTLRADQRVGDQGSNVNSANVTYGMTCTVTAYDYQGAQNIVKGLITQKATSTLSPGYTLINNIQTSLTGHTVTNNTLSLFFSGKGVWAYQFSDAQKLQLAKALAGKTVAQAQSILKSTPGVGTATINVNGGNTLPTDYNQISIVIQPIGGLSSGGTPPPTIASPTVTGPTNVQSGNPGGNGKGGSPPPVGGS